MSRKFYAVARGRKPGIYTNWASCKRQVNGHSYALYQSFNEANWAIDYFRQNYNGLDKEEIIKNFESQLLSNKYL